MEIEGKIFVQSIEMGEKCRARIYKNNAVGL